jgi:hypothetical protein
MKKLISILGVICMVFTCNVSPMHAQEGVVEDAAPGYLDPEALDAFLSVGEYDGPVLGLEEIPGIDSAFDKFDELSPIDFELGFTVASAYIWRGQELGSDASFQPYVTVSPSFEPLGDISFTYWADITKNSPDRNDLEHDFVLDYNFDMLDLLEIGGYNRDEEPYLATKLFDFNFDAGYIYYSFPPFGGTKSQEVYFGVSYNLPLHPSFYIYNDWDRGRGSWYQFGLSQDLDLGAFTLSTYANLGYNKGQWGADSQFSTLDMGISLPIPVGKHQTLSPFLSFTKELDDDGANLVNDRLYGGLNYSITF